MTTTAKPALYFVMDRRQDGGLRIVAEFHEPGEALAAAQALRAAGDAVDVLLALAVDPIKEQ